VTLTTRTLQYPVPPIRAGQLHLLRPDVCAQRLAPANRVRVSFVIKRVRRVTISMLNKLGRRRAGL
jgi:hypothetical protein